MKKGLLSVFLVLFMSFAFAQDKTVEGIVTDAADNSPVIGANVLVKGTTTGTVTDIDGKFKLTVPKDSKTLVISYVGMTTQEVAIPESGSVTVALSAGKNLNEVVVTALGVKREAKSVGYATQKIEGSSLADAKDANIVNSMQGKVAGVQITGNSNLGGSSRITIRGIKSLTGNNQPLWVVDGIVIDNSNYATSDVQQGSLGYDYGNAAQDINSDDIEDMQVLKGPAASALYGSRGANGVILITTKKGSKHAEKGKSPIGVSFQQDVMFNKISVFPNYQNEYGGGYAPNFLPDESNPSQDRVRLEDDGSWGPKMQGQMVRQWTSYYAYDSANYGKLTPFVAHPNNVKDFFQTGYLSNSNLTLDGANDKGAFRLSFSNLSQKGTVPNSSLKRNTLSFSGSYNFTDKLFADITANYVLSEGKGRAEVGYNSLFSNLTQWFQRSLDMNELKNYKNPDGTQHTWNLISPDGGTTWTPYFWDNPYWTAYENYENDRRDRIFGRVNAGYKFTNWLTLKGGVSTDYYSDMREERVAVNSVVAAPKYSQNQITNREMNYELMLTAHKIIKNDYDITAFIGVNRREENYRNNYSSTQGGLNVPNFYTLENSVSAVLVQNYLSRYRQNSIYGSFSFGWKGMLFVDFTGRNDWSSSLPLNNCSYFYPSLSGSFVFSELIKSKWFSFGKLRAGWAQVGNDTRPYRLETRPSVSSSFNGNGNFVIPNIINNPALRPEKIYSWEIGLDLNFFVDRIHIDATYYNSVTKDNIFNVRQSGAAGSTSRYVNAGTLANQGVELATMFVPVKLKNGFSWSVGFNFAKNYNVVKELYKDASGKDVNSLQLGNSGWGATLEARPGMAYGQIVGSDFYYDDKGNKIVDPNTGMYLINTNVKPLGTILPDFTGGVSTTLSYKGLSAYFLFDFQKGGKLFSVTNMWGKYDGTLAETAVNGVRENGLVAPGVNAKVDGSGNVIYDANGNPSSDGTKNTTNVNALDYYQGNYNGYYNNKVDVYDATFVKFREFRLTYSFDPKFLKKTPIRGVNVGVIGRNLAILKKSVPNIDPEVANSSSNIQGFEGGNKPAERSIGFTFGFKF